MAAYYLRSSSSSPFAISTAVTLGTYIHVARTDAQSNFAVMRRYVYEVTTAGTTAGTTPVFPTTPGSTVTSGTAVLTCRECTSWVTANPYMDYIATRLAAGDTLYVSQAHSETSSLSLTFTFAGTNANPNVIICGDDSAEPPTTTATTAAISTTGNSGFFFNGCISLSGIVFTAGNSTVGTSAFFNLCNTNGNQQQYNDCDFILGTTSTSQRLNATPTAGSGATKTTWFNCRVKFSSTSQCVNSGRGFFEWRGGSLISGTSSPTAMFNTADGNSGSNPVISGIDFSVASSSMSLFGVVSGVSATVSNCKLPTSWSGSLITGTITARQRVEMHNCDSADTNYRFAVQDYYGTTVSETTLVKTGTTYDGTGGYSYKMTTTANTSYPSGAHESLQLPAVWNSTVGSSRTVTVDILHDNVTDLTNSEIWLEVQYLGTSGYPLSTYISDEKASPLVNSAAQDTSTATWTTTGMSNPNTQKLVVTFTPQEAGYFTARVYLTKPSKTVYIDPELQVT